MYEANISTVLIFCIINAVIGQVKPLDTPYPMFYLDYLVVKTRQTKVLLHSGKRSPNITQPSVSTKQSPAVLVNFSLET